MGKNEKLAPRMAFNSSQLLTRLLPIVFAPLCLLSLALAAAGCAGGPEPPPPPELAAEGFSLDLQELAKPRIDAWTAQPDDPVLNGELAVLLHAFGQLEAAETLYARAEALDAGEARWTYLRGVLRARRGDNLGAAESFRRSLERRPDLAAARRGLGDVLLDEGQIDEARTTFDQVLSANPDDAAARLGLGRVEAAAGNPAEAAGQLERAVELVPGYGQAHYALGLAYRDLDRQDASRRHLKLHESNPYRGPPSDDPYLPDVQRLNSSPTELLQQAAEAEDRGDLERALALTNKAVEKDPVLVQGHVNLLILYGRKGDAERARLHYERAVELDPERADLHYNYGVLLYSSGTPSEAKRAFAKAIESNPNYASALNNYGQMLEIEGRVEEAIGYYRRALDSQPDYLLARYHLGRMLLGQGRSTEAVEVLEPLAATRTADTADYLYLLAAAHQRTGNGGQARRTAEQALSVARQLGQQDLAAEIERSLETMPR